MLFLLFMTCSNNKASELILSTAYFPNVEYFALINLFDGVMIDVNETFPKQTYRNRCSILTANGPLNLVLPVSKPNGNKSLTKDVTIFDREKWHLNHTRAISSAYSTSPFYIHYIDEFIGIFDNKWDNLIDLNTEIIERILTILEISKNINYTDNFLPVENTHSDFRFAISPKVKSDLTSFDEYTQVFSDRYAFFPNLSVLDLIFNLGPRAKDYLDNVSNKILNS